MIYAEHIIGLTPLEHARIDDPATAAAVRARFEAIRQSGQLRSHGHPRGLQDDGSTQKLDALAGDDRLVFLSRGPRYRESHPAALCYGFLFDPAQLVSELGARVGPDLLDDYEALLEEIVRAVDASLPPLPEMTADELANDPLLAGEDADMLAAVAAAARSRFWDITDAVLAGDLGVDGAAEATAEFKRRAAVLQARMRRSDPAALAQHAAPELTLPGPLPLDLALGVIEAGELRLF